MNPFSLDFGAEPNLYISRTIESRKILDTFTSEIPSTHIYMITGVRGCGKTVLMTSVSHTIAKEKDWIYCDLNGERNTLESLAAFLSKSLKKKSIKLKALNTPYFGAEIERSEIYTDIQTDLDEMLQELNNEGKKLLITLDEAVNSQNIRELTTYFQHCLREKYPVFLLMTGLYKNLRALQNNRSQTFLRRCPKIELEPLNIRRIANVYADVFDIDESSSKHLADMTNGYSYAFQILGYIMCDYNKKEADQKVLREYKAMLDECSYEKIWEELSQNERLVASAIAKLGNKVSVKDVKAQLEMDSNNFSTYQATLENMGLLSNATAYGVVSFTLPYFADFINMIS